VRSRLEEDVTRDCARAREEERLLDSGALADDPVDPIALAKLAPEATDLTPRRPQRAPVAGGGALELRAAERLAHDDRHVRRYFRASRGNRSRRSFIASTATSSDPAR